MEQGGGLLKVIIVKGNDLAIRDFKSSDPYVVTKLGKQASLHFSLFPWFKETSMFFSLSF